MTVYATYVGSPRMVKAAQLTEETADAICRWTNGYRLGPDRWVPQEGCWRVSALRWWPVTDYRLAEEMHRRRMLFIGIRTRNGEEIAYEFDFVVQGNGGAFSVARPSDFTDLYQALPAEGRDR